MISAQSFLQQLISSDIKFFTGVPDSALKDVLLEIDKEPDIRHIITANEGNSIALAAGYHFATGKIPLVYMQNSGLGNSINPLISLADKEVYKVPLLLLIGWRGEPGQKDEPQHVAQGRITEQLLNTMGIPHAILPQDPSKLEASLGLAIKQIKESHGTYAFLVKKNTFEPAAKAGLTPSAYKLSREEALQLITEQIKDTDVIVSTTGKTSRELFECREKSGQGHHQEFLTVGSMGHCSQIALGVALNKPNRIVYCLDGDGALIMHMGSLAIIGSQSPSNFIHIVINNGAHESVGGQDTAGFAIDPCAIALACGYRSATLASDPEAIKKALDNANSTKGPNFIEIRVNKKSRSDLGRPTISPEQAKTNFMDHLKD